MIDVMMYDDMYSSAVIPLTKNTHFNNTKSSFIVLCSIFLKNFFRCYFFTESIFIISRIMECSIVFNFLVDVSITEASLPILKNFETIINLHSVSLGCTIQIIGKFCFSMHTFWFIVSEIIVLAQTSGAIIYNCTKN